jgi:hypothetical protein
VVLSPEQKYCSDCGSVILRKAEICPKCGCRQIPVQNTSVFTDAAATLSQSARNPITGPMILLLCLNVLWNGLGNLAVGDKRGWGYGFLNWVFFIASIFTAGIPCILFFAYCGYQGYQYLSRPQAGSQAARS